MSDSCIQIIQDYGLRSIGLGERALPRTDFTLCHEFTLIGSGMIWNIYFGVLALAFGFLFSTALALGKNSETLWLRKPADWFVFLFRGSPLFIQFFLAYELLSALPRSGFDVLGITIETSWVTRAWAGATLVLFLNTSAYAAEIFYGALRSVPKGDMEAADAYGFSGWKKFRKITWPTMLRLAWPSYTNEAIFLFHSTALVFFSGFPAFRQEGDALYYASYIADKTFNPFVAYPIAAFYFVCLTLIVISVFGLINRRLNRHMPGAVGKLKIRPNLIR
ncbi:ABC transporter permease subunit [Thioclava sp. GXIMD2076]|uniref:ABC transporter permease subunit n=1 Tax=Thioclava kandeliae TaxID=3070818 RepID=A0ABV1SH70_9RHOB